jgi:peptidoglycan/xylan/chitin deacetylase (PgdA/CDA1 family)
VALQRVSRNAREALEVPRDLLLRRYPPFVTGGQLAPGDVPVFVFHDAEAESFARKLAYLADNGYATLSVDEYVGILRGQRRAPERACLLTFDDGRGSIWSVAAPLLRRHGMRAVVFLVPGRMRSVPGPPAPTLEDVEAGRADASALAKRQDAAGALLCWEEVEALARTGLADFQSHTLLHARVHTAPHLAGFATPWSRHGPAAFDQPLLRTADRDLLGEEIPLGTPLLRSAPRTSEEARFLEQEDVRAACVATVAEEGGEAFFLRADWEKRLRRAFSRGRVQGRVESPEERTSAIRHELVESRALIEERTGRPVVHLCYPWHTAGPTARRLAAEVGYETAFCGKVPGVPLTRPGGDPRAIARLGEDYLELLPGRGRATLAEILRLKWRRRFGPSLR